MTRLPYARHRTPKTNQEELKAAAARTGQDIYMYRRQVAMLEAANREINTRLVKLEVSALMRAPSDCRRAFSSLPPASLPSLACLLLHLTALLTMPIPASEQRQYSHGSASAARAVTVTPPMTPTGSLPRSASPAAASLIRQQTADGFVGTTTRGVAQGGVPQEKRSQGGAGTAHVTAHVTPRASSPTGFFVL